MTKSDKAEAWAVVGWGIILLIWCVVVGLIVAPLGIPPLITGGLNFIIVFAFFVSPWYTRYTRWMEDRVLEILKRKDSGDKS